MFDWVKRLTGLTIDDYDIGDRVTFKGDKRYVTVKKPYPTVYVIKDKGEHVGYKLLRENSTSTIVGRYLWDRDLISADKVPPEPFRYIPITPSPATHSIAQRGRRY